MNVYPFLVMLFCCVPTARIHDSIVIVNNLPVEVQYVMK